MFELYIAFFILYFAWLALVITTFNAYITPGLTSLYRVFLIHFLFSSIYVFLMIFRPGWNGNVVKTTFDSPVGCFFMGLLLNLSVLAGWLLVTYFNFLKFDFYYTLMRDRLSFTRFVLRICLVFYLNSAIAFLIVEKHGPSHRYGYDNCGETNIHGRILYQFCTVILFVINGIMAYTFWKYRHWKHAAILNIDHQLMVNVYLSPFLFFSTILCTFLGLMWQKEGMYKKGTYISIHLFEHLIDCFMNSMLMYYYIFELINSEPQSNLGILQDSRDERMSRTQSGDSKTMDKNHSNSEKRLVTPRHSHSREITFLRGHENLRCNERTLAHNNSYMRLGRFTVEMTSQSGAIKRADQLGSTTDVLELEIAPQDKEGLERQGYETMEVNEPTTNVAKMHMNQTTDGFAKDPSTSDKFDKTTSSASDRFEVQPLPSGERELSASSESDLYTETGPDHDPTFSYQWIALPGGHPILCTRAVIIAHGLHKFIVTKPDELHLIKLYQSRGHMQNLMRFCNTTDDLVTSLNAMGFQVPGAAAPRPQRSVDMSMFYE